MPVAQGTKKANVKATYAIARHETFHLRDGWLFKGLDAIISDSGALYSPDAHHDLGVGINMRKSIVYWVQATSLATLTPDGNRHRPSLTLTDAGGLLYQYDPHLEDIGSLWLLHIELASNMHLATSWYWTFNELPQREFAEERLVGGISQWLMERGATKVVPASLLKDARCVLRTYLPGRGEPRRDSEEALDCPLASLDLLRQSSVGREYRFQVGARRNLPLSLFAYCLYRFKERTRPKESVLALDDLRWAPFSPGRLLGLDARAILDHMEELEQTGPLARLVRTAGLNMVTLKQDVKATDLLRNYYSLGRRRG